MSDSPNKELLSIDLDPALFEQKIARIQAKLAEVQRVMAAGGDVTAARAAFDSEVAGLGRLTAGGKEAASATQELIRNKEKFAAVLQLVGGQMGPVLGQYQHLATLIVAGGPIAVGMAATAVAIGLVVNGLREMAAASEKAREAEERRLAATQSAQDRDVAATKAMAEALKSGGVDSITAGVQAREALRTKFAITGADTTITAGIQANVRDEETLAKLALLGQQQGATITGKNAQEVLQKNQAQADELLRRQVEFAGTDVGRTIAGGAAARAFPELGAVGTAFRILKDTGVFPAGVDTPEKLRRFLDAHPAYSRGSQTEFDEYYRVSDAVRQALDSSDVGTSTTLPAGDAPLTFDFPKEGNKRGGDDWLNRGRAGADRNQKMAAAAQRMNVNIQHMNVHGIHDAFLEIGLLLNSEGF